MSDWFRKSTWTKEDQDDFWERFRRARPDSRAQYLRIQAFHLSNSGTRELQEAAEVLLGILISDYRESTQLALAFAQRAAIHAAAGNTRQAITDYRAALAQEQQFPNIQSQAWIEFAWLVATEGIEDAFDEAASVLAKCELSSPFPLDRFRSSAARAFMAFRRGAADEAKNHARFALELANSKQSGLRHHKALGLVGPEWDPIRLHLLGIVDRGSKA